MSSIETKGGMSEALKLGIQIGSVLILVGMLYQVVLETQRQTRITADGVESLRRDVFEFRIESTAKQADMQARLRAIEDKVRVGKVD
jgi:hypothetical protein